MAAAVHNGRRCHGAPPCFFYETHSSQTLRPELPDRWRHHRRHRACHRSPAGPVHGRDRSGPDGPDPAPGRAPGPAHRDRTGPRPGRAPAPARAARRGRVRRAQGGLSRHRCAPGRAQAAHCGQPALQHLQPHPLSPARAGGRGRGPALHAAKGGHRPHGGLSGHGRLWAADGHAAVALCDGERAVRAARELQSAAQGGQRRRAHGPARGAGGPGREAAGGDGAGGLQPAAQDPAQHAGALAGSQGL